MNSHDVIVRVNGLGKCFKLYDNPLDRLKDWASFGRVRRWTDYWALKDVSFEVRRGECFGVIGENGAGKSTLLKILTGAMYASEGEVEVKGRVLSLLELGTGFSPELTGRQNIHNSASLLGFPQDYVNAERIQRIEDFADIGEFFDHPVRIYSSGMYVRLAFSMFMFMEPDVFIIDEALSVGDIFFSQKCFTKIRELKERGITFIFVSHDINAVQNLSDKVMLLSLGRNMSIGSPTVIFAHYHSSKHKNSALFSGESYGGKVSNKPINDSFSHFDEIIRHSVLTGRDRHGDGGMEIIAARVVDNNGVDTMSVQMMGELSFYVLIKAHRDIRAPHVGFGLYDRMNNSVFSTTTTHLGFNFGDIKAGTLVVAAFKVSLDVHAGEYTFHLVCGERTYKNKPSSGNICDFHTSLGPIRVTFDYSAEIPPYYGIARIPMEVIAGF